jgi:hypothetical protein
MLAAGSVASTLRRRAGNPTVTVLEEIAMALKVKSLARARPGVVPKRLLHAATSLKARWLPLVSTVEHLRLEVTQARSQPDRMAVDESAGCRQLTGASLNVRFLVSWVSAFATLSRVYHPVGQSPGAKQAVHGFIT